MHDVVIVEAVRTPIGRRNGALSTFHAADLLSVALRAVVDRAGIDPRDVGQVVGGCVSQVGMQSFNVTRTAWLTAGLPSSVSGSTVDSQCGSSQQALNIAASLVGSGVMDTAVACGVEVMSRVPMGSNLGQGVGKAIPRSYFSQYEFTTQFEAAERMAEKWGLTRDDADLLAVLSQERAAQAWTEGRFDTQVVPVDAPVLDDDGKPTGDATTVGRDECLRQTTKEALAALRPVARADGIHTAGTSSQIADGAAAILLMAREKAIALGLEPRARVVDTCLIGCDPVLMLSGPIDATHHLLARTGRSINDIDVVEINEAFASVVLCWERELQPDATIVNPNGGAIALGHPLGATGVILATKAVHELERRDGTTALITMCCGGGLATGTLIERAA
jgi:acetyl-CoA C-acetyltransferase